MMYRYISILLLFSSCVGVQKASKVATKNPVNAAIVLDAIHTKQEQTLAKRAAVWYPVKEKEQTTTETVAGNSEALKAELRKAEQRADSLAATMALLPVKDECKPEVAARDRVIAGLQQTIARLSTYADNLKADLVKTTTVTTQENTAAVQAAELKAAEAQAKYIAEANSHAITKDQLQEKAGKLRNAYIIFAVCGGILALLVIAKFYFRF